MLLFALLLTAPRFEVLGLRPALAVEASADYEAIVATMEAAAGKAISRSDRVIVIEESKQLRSADAGMSRLGRVYLRPDARALKHEIAHQVLLLHCAQSADDRLFHEAFALAVSGELERWLQEGYFSSVKAEKTLLALRSFDTPDARQALARLIGDGQREHALPVAVARRLVVCVNGARWKPMRVEELSAPAAALTGDAFIALSRHSGEVLQASGDVQLAMPFGSVLKPFVVAGSVAEPPSLHVDARDPLWRCGEALPERMDAAMALQRSCNGYFLAWEELVRDAARFGVYGELLLSLGLERLPEHMDEAIGLRPTLALSVWQVAQLYRVLAAARPDVVTMLARTAQSGTLSALASSRALEAYALKTGTVRDPRNNVELGWIVAIAPDWIAVMVQKGQMPRSFAERFAERLARLVETPLARKVSVQVFGLLDLADVELECAGIGVVLAPSPALMQRAFVPITRLNGDALCLGQPFRVRFPGIDPRFYAGGFTPSAGPPLALSGARARRGSDLVFSTTAQRYVSGVLQSEDAAIDGEARRALAKVVLHNTSVARHHGRPLCDTTHCQAFQGTPARPRPLGRLDGLAPWIDAQGWLPFSRGGEESWARDVALEAVRGALGMAPIALSFSASEAHVVTLHNDVEERETIGCERLRGPLKLPSCPQRASISGSVVHFEGRGRGHGLGLDVEAAKASGARAETLLERAYLP